jgi:hypothetical protein
MVLLSYFIYWKKKKNTSLSQLNFSFFSNQFYNKNHSKHKNDKTSKKKNEDNKDGIKSNVYKKKSIPCRGDLSQFLVYRAKQSAVQHCFVRPHTSVQYTRSIHICRFQKTKKQNKNNWKRLFMSCIQGIKTYKK